MRETALFHLQQAIEKSLKAYLIWSEVDSPHTHDIELLLNIASEKDAGFDKFESVADLTDFAVAGRYPESDQWIEECNPTEWMPIAQNICNFIWDKVVE